MNVDAEFYVFRQLGWAMSIDLNRIADQVTGETLAEIRGGKVVLKKDNLPDDVRNFLTTLMPLHWLTAGYRTYGTDADGHVWMETFEGEHDSPACGICGEHVAQGWLCIDSDNEREVCSHHVVEDTLALEMEGTPTNSP